MMIPLEQLETVVKALVRQALAEMLGMDKPETPQWLPLSKASTYLGYDSDASVYRDIEDGLLRIGQEVQDRRRPGTSRPRYYLNIPKCDARFNSAR
jgi:hypothetical protein